MKTSQTQLQSIFLQLGMSDTEYLVYQSILQYGPKPASSIASLAHLERTYTYKIIKRLMSLGIINETVIKNTKNYTVDNIQPLYYLIQQQQQELSNTSSILDELKPEIEQLIQHRNSLSPSFRVFDGMEAIQNCYHDMLTYIKKNNLLSIEILYQSLVEHELVEHKGYSESQKEFLTECKKYHVSYKISIISGILTLDHCSSIDNNNNHHHTICIGQTQTCIIGSRLYMLLFKDIPLAFRLDHGDMTDMISFLIANQKN